MPVTKDGANSINSTVTKHEQEGGFQQPVAFAGVNVFVTDIAALPSRAAAPQVDVYHQVQKGRANEPFAMTVAMRPWRLRPEKEYAGIP